MKTPWSLKMIQLQKIALSKPKEKEQKLRKDCSRVTVI